MGYDKSETNISDKENPEENENMANQGSTETEKDTEETVEMNDASEKAEEENPEEGPASDDEDDNQQEEEQVNREDELNRLLSELAESKDKYIRLSAEFDNYRRRTLKEKMDLTKTAGEDLMLKILPVVDDFERAMGSMREAKDCNAIFDGITLIYNKFKEFLTQQGVKEIEAFHQEFDTDLHEALTKIPAPKKKLKGKVVDVVEKGYRLNDKVIRFSKVVIGE